VERPGRDYWTRTRSHPYYIDASGEKIDFQSYKFQFGQNAGMTDFATSLHQYHSLMKEAVLDFKKGCCVCGLIRIKTTPYNHRDIDLSSLAHDPTKHKAPAPNLHFQLGLSILKPELCREPSQLPICDLCKHQLDACIIPVKAIANGRWNGAIPPCIERLNYMERRVLYPVQLRAILITLSPHHGPNTYRGNMVSWPSNINKLHSVLPISAHDTNALVQVVTVGFKEKVTPRVNDLLLIRSTLLIV